MMIMITKPKAGEVWVFGGSNLPLNLQTISHDNCNKKTIAVNKQV